MVFADGRFVIWVSRLDGHWDAGEYVKDVEIWLCDANCHVIAKLDTLLGNDKKDRIATWAKQYKLDTADLNEKKSTVFGDFQVKIEDTRLELYQQQNQTRKAVFYCDANISLAILYPDNTLAVGDKNGRVLFLRYTDD